MHELNAAASEPLRVWAETNRMLFSNPFSPLSYLPGSEKVAASSELMGRLVRRYEKPEWQIDAVHLDGKRVPVRVDLVMEQPFCRLVHFRRACRRKDPAVLLVAPMSGHHATLLRDTVRSLIRDHEVYVTDWIDARLVPLSRGDFHLDHYVAYVRDFLRRLGPGTHVVAVCQPTVPVLAAVSLMAEVDDPDTPASMVLMGGPLDTRVNPTEVNRYAKTRSLRWFETHVVTRVPTKYAGYMRRVYPGFLQHAGFVSMNADRHLQAHVDFYNHLVEGDGDSAEAHRTFYDEYNAVMDLPAEFYLETIRAVFQDHDLPRGELRVFGRRVQPAAVHQTALMTVEGALDDISAPGQTEAAHRMCFTLPHSKREHFVMPGVGHYGIFSGRRWRETIYPRLRDFIRRHADGEWSEVSGPVEATTV